ncbi:unnamed protein product [Heligmosomoides polygyrus]|uniref:Uncharacterized protein n=1 Tax=Heligmosomoides polygyrus TaxID=6339 RepID=A0A183GRT1_HELPZ|nr:unnamed protein product [Heligmosomoides polygyrus]
MDEEVVDVIQKMVEGTSTSSATSRRENNDDVADVIDELLDRISVWYEPSNLEIDFNQADYRKAPSMASASSVSGSEIMDLSDSELPFLESGEDSEKEFERLQGYTSALRVKTYKQEHSDGVPQEKKLRADRVDKSDLEHEWVHIH